MRNKIAGLTCMVLYLSLAAGLPSALASEADHEQDVIDAPSAYSVETCTAFEESSITITIQDTVPEIDRLLITLPGGEQQILEGGTQFSLTVPSDWQGQSISYIPGSAGETDILWYENLGGAFAIPVAESDDDNGIEDTTPAGDEGSGSETASSDEGAAPSENQDHISDYAAAGDTGVSDSVQTDAQTGSQTDAQTDVQTDAQTDTQTDTQADTQEDTQTDTQNAGNTETQEGDVDTQSSAGAAGSESSGSSKSSTKSGKTVKTSSAASGSQKSSGSTTGKSKSAGTGTSSSGETDTSRSGHSSSAASRPSKSGTAASTGKSATSGGSSKASKGKGGKKTSASQTGEDENDDAQEIITVTEAKSELGKFLLSNDKTLVYSPDEAPEEEGMTYEATWEQEEGIRIYLYEEGGAILELSSSSETTTSREKTENSGSDTADTAKNNSGTMEDTDYSGPSTLQFMLTLEEGSKGNQGTFP